MKPSSCSKIWQWKTKSPVIAKGISTSMGVVWQEPFLQLSTVPSQLSLPVNKGTLSCRMLFEDASDEWFFNSPEVKTLNLVWCIWKLWSSEGTLINSQCSSQHQTTKQQQAMEPRWCWFVWQHVGWVEAIAETHHNWLLMRWVSRCSTHPLGYQRATKKIYR